MDILSLDPEAKRYVSDGITEHDFGQLIEDISETIRRNDSGVQIDVILMNSEMILMLLSSGYLEGTEDDCTCCGITVARHDRLADMEIVLTNQKYMQSFIAGPKVLMPEEDDPYPDWKPKPKMYHCRVCGAGYYDKKEAKECMRSHDWQNRKGRR